LKLVLVPVNIVNVSSLQQFLNEKAFSGDVGKDIVGVGVMEGVTVMVGVNEGSIQLHSPD